MIKAVTKFGDPVLRTKCAEFTPPDSAEEINALAELSQNLLDTMKNSRGVGLAAPQIGIALRVCAVDVRNARYPSTLEFTGATKEARGVKLTNGMVLLTHLEGDGVGMAMPLILVNPVLTTSGDVYSAQEGCLSSNDGAFLKVPRSRKVTVKALDHKGQPLEFIATNFLARVIQHEVDHLDGVLYTDRANTKK
jgi:peptide deformylase